MIIPFEPAYREKYYQLLDEVFDSSFLSDGPMNTRFEQTFSTFTNLLSCTVSNGGSGLLALLKYTQVENQDVIVPTNTFIATARAVELAGGNVIYADCKKEDLCIGLPQIKAVLTPKTKAIVVVHVGGHLAFDIFEIAKFCEENNIALIEDCAHAHGAIFKGKAAGSFGIGGSYSFYATKTLPLGEGGVVASTKQDVIDFVKMYRNYGKKSSGPGKFDYPIKGFNLRMNEITAALGIVQMERLQNILEWKRALAKKFDQIFPEENRIHFPDQMISGYYKYIVFDIPLKEKTGSVFDTLCHDIDQIPLSCPNAEWIKDHHSCAPIFYGWEQAEASLDTLREVLLPDLNTQTS